MVGWVYGAKSYYRKAGGLSGSNKRGTFQKIQENSNMKMLKVFQKRHWHHALVLYAVRVQNKSCQPLEWKGIG